MSNRLHCYDAKRESGIIGKWHEMITKRLDDPLKQLIIEAQDAKGKEGTRMYEYFLRANESKKKLKILTWAQNLVVIMYTDDNDDKAFYREYNMASAHKIWEPYRVYTTILMSAFKEMAMWDPIDSGTTLYRGIKVKHDKLDPDLIPDRIFWKTFTSTSLDRSLAEDFSRDSDGRVGTVLEFHPVSCHAVKIWELSVHPDEYEVFLSPFEAYDFEREVYDSKSPKLRFKKSARQEFLPQIAPVKPKGTTRCHVSWPDDQQEEYRQLVHNLLKKLMK